LPSPGERKEEGKNCRHPYIRGKGKAGEGGKEKDCLIIFLPKKKRDFLRGRKKKRCWGERGGKGDPRFFREKKLVRPAGKAFFREKKEGKERAEKKKGRSMKKKEGTERAPKGRKSKRPFFIGGKKWGCFTVQKKKKREGGKGKEKNNAGKGRTSGFMKKGFSKGGNSKEKASQKKRGGKKKDTETG